ncbi:MAG: DNA-3-methyladenine glycosylase 2 family protein [Gemmatimonadota bacterium]
MHPPLLADPTMAALCQQHGPARLKTRPAFESLLGAIASQQISGRAAATILGRLRRRVGFTQRALATAHLNTLRASGLSRAKSLATRDLARFARAGGLRGLDRMSDESVIERLIQVRGIGVWTAHMFLMFSLGRVDVWPIGDGGVQRAAATLYGTTDQETLLDLGERFRPWRSHAAWYLWRSLDG